MIHVIFISDADGHTVVKKICSTMRKAIVYVLMWIDCINVKFTLTYNSGTTIRWNSSAARVEIKSYITDIEDYVYVLSYTNRRGNVYVDDIFDKMMHAMKCVKSSHRYLTDNYVLKYSSSTRKSWRSANGKIDIIRYQIE